jgi:hypothetical protein|tara:strand:+ start:2950 stop:3075 length:126 start_codon:yes stop_codon:yes gene_type:complete
MSKKGGENRGKTGGKREKDFKIFSFPFLVPKIFIFFSAFFQ